MNNDLFYNRLKKESSIPSPKDLNNKILSIAEHEFKSRKKISLWIPSSAFALVLILFITYRAPQHRMDGRLSFESSEMILHYDDIELMVQASNLTDEDWKKLEGLK